MGKFEWIFGFRRVEEDTILRVNVDSGFRVIGVVRRRVIFDD